MHIHMYGLSHVIQAELPVEWTRVHMLDQPAVRSAELAVFDRFTVTCLVCRYSLVGP